MIQLALIPKICLKTFKEFCFIIKILIIVGLAIGIFETLTGIDIPYTAPISEGVSLFVVALLYKMMNKMGNGVDIQAKNGKRFVYKIKKNAL